MKGGVLFGNECECSCAFNAKRTKCELGQPLEHKKNVMKNICILNGLRLRMAEGAGAVHHIKTGLTQCSNAAMIYSIRSSAEASSFGGTARPTKEWSCGTPMQLSAFYDVELRHRFDLEAARALAPLPNLPCREIGRFNVAAKAVGIEQRVAQSILCKLAANRLQPRRIRRQLQGQRFKFVEASGHQLRQADSMEKAGSDAAGKGLAPADDQWQSRPQRVARRGVGIIGQGVEKQISQTMAREVFLQG